jgi:hypothetical protein
LRHLSKNSPEGSKDGSTKPDKTNSQNKVEHVSQRRFATFLVGLPDVSVHDEDIQKSKRHWSGPCHLWCAFTNP